MVRRHIICLCLLAVVSRAQIEPAPSPTAPPSPASPPSPAADVGEEEPPEGYYAFVESPNATPPRVRPPPYRQVSSECSEARDPRPHVTANNLCGDLNRGIIPKNPMGHSLNGEPYPFELVRNLTLRFLSRTLPVLRADDTLPRVTHLAHAHAHGTHGTQGTYGTHGTHSTHGAQGTYAQEEPDQSYDEFGDNNRLSRHRRRRAAGEGEEGGEGGRDSRKFCDNGGVFCMLYRAINGDSAPAASAGVERREDPGAAPLAPHRPAPPRYEGPPTPCPARVEYATPVFARNYQGVWRYVVQIPYEGYFTQTVEVTRCMQSRCHYLDGGCLSSPRWVSLLVAELHYPPSSPPSPASPPAPAPAAPAPAPVQPQINDFQEYHQYLQKRAGVSSDGEFGSAHGATGTTDKPQHCDGHDELGCFQVRLYYDWFLVPGSCKCWRPDYFARYVRRRNTDSEL